jgi:hypothetical protein
MIVKLSIHAVITMNMERRWCKDAERGNEKEKRKEERKRIY